MIGTENMQICGCRGLSSHFTADVGRWRRSRDPVLIRTLRRDLADEMKKKLVKSRESNGVGSRFVPI
jgi:hypothetical protein